MSFLFNNLAFPDLKKVFGLTGTTADEPLDVEGEVALDIDEGDMMAGSTGTTDPVPMVVPIANPPTADIVSDAGPLRSLQTTAANIPTPVLVIGGIVTAVVIVLAMARARAQKRAAQVKGIAGFIQRVRGK